MKIPRLTPEYMPADFNCYREWEQTASQAVNIANAHGSNLFNATRNVVDSFEQGDYVRGFVNAACLGGSAAILYGTGGLCTVTVQFMPDHGRQVGITWAGIS